MAGKQSSEPVAAQSVADLLHRRSIAPLQNSTIMPTMEKPSRRRGRKSAKDSLADGEFTIDDLAQRSGTTVRNIRAYQDRGILAPPEKRGRMGVYNEGHAARLDIISNLLDRGYSIDNIKELIAAWKQGRNLDDILGFERAITLAFHRDQSREYSIAELLKMFGISRSSKSQLDDACRLGILERKGTHFIAPSPDLLDAGAKLTELGMPFEEILELFRLLRGNVQRAADGLVKIAVDRFDEFGDELPPQETITELSELIWKLRPIAHQAIRSEAELALSRSLRNFLGERMSAILEHLHDDDGEIENDKS